MKTILLSISVLTTLSLNAQYFSEDWTAPQAWALQQGPTDTDTNNWLVATSGAFPLQGAGAISQSWIPNPAPNGTALTPDNFLISPVIDLTAVSGTVILSFKAGSPEPTASGFYEEFLSVYAFDGLNGFAAALASPVHSQVLAGGEQMYEFSYDISTLAGVDSLMLAFRHHNCTDENFIFLDDIFVASDAGIETNTNAAFVYPNPATDVLNIKLTENATSVSVIEMNGKVFSKESVNSNLVSVNVADLVSGVYFYEVVTENGTVIRNTFVKK